MLSHTARVQKNIFVWMTSDLWYDQLQPLRNADKKRELQVILAASVQVAEKKNQSYEGWEWIRQEISHVNLTTTRGIDDPHPVLLMTKQFVQKMLLDLS